MNLFGISDAAFTQQKNLKSATTFRLESVSDYLEVKSVDALQRALPILTQNKTPYIVLGWGANQILPPRYKGVVIHLDLPFDASTFEKSRDSYSLPASLGLNLLTGHAVKFGLKGWDVFTGIPASLGGAIYMNAGTNLGEIGALVTEVSLVTPAGKLRVEKMDEKSFAYRKNFFVGPGEVIVGAKLKHLGLDPEIPQKIKSYLEYRKTTQPLATKNCGCVFKNPMKELPAGKLIDLLGLKSLECGGLQISSKHANFIENHGESSWDHFKTLTETIKFEMDVFYGIEFELEVKIPYP
jgi:UDP-N-acetylmuramate dehydrogenase